MEGIFDILWFCILFVYLESRQWFVCDYIILLLLLLLLGRKDEKTDIAIRRDSSVRFHTYAQKSSGNQLLPKFIHRLNTPTYRMACEKFGDNLVLGFFITGCQKNTRFLSKQQKETPVFYQNSGDHCNGLHCRSAVIYVTHRC